MIRLLAAPLLAAALIAGGATAASASRPTGISGAHGHTCTYTSPESSINADGAQLAVQPGHPSFTATYVPGRMRGVYLTTGYYNSKNSDATPAYGGCNGLVEEFNARRTYSQHMPVMVGHQGKPVGSMTTVTSPGFRGDTGYDLWFSPSKATTYNGMANGGVEIMIWDRSVGLGGPHSYATRISGHRWGVTAGLASQGHGRSAAHPRGWTVVNFIRNDHGNGRVTMNGLQLNPFIAYAIRHYGLPPHSWWMACDRGAEMFSGSVSVVSSVKGLN